MIRKIGVMPSLEDIHEEGRLFDSPHEQLKALTACRCYLSIHDPSQYAQAGG